MTKGSEEIFQERLDELLLMEHKAELRIQQLTKHNETFQNDTNKVLARLDGVIRTVSNDIHTLGEVNDIANERMQALARYTKKIIITFVVALLIIVLVGGWTAMRLKYLNYEIKLAEAKLKLLDLELKVTPVIVKYNGEDYVRVHPNTETRLARGGKPVGVYAKAWHDKR
jgi:predicted DNA repair protein MutK